MGGTDNRYGVWVTHITGTACGWHREQVRRVASTDNRYGVWVAQRAGTACGWHREQVLRVGGTESRYGVWVAESMYGVQAEDISGTACRQSGYVQVRRVGCTGSRCGIWVAQITDTACGRRSIGYYCRLKWFKYDTTILSRTRHISRLTVSMPDSRFSVTSGPSPYQCRIAGSR